MLKIIRLTPSLATPLHNRLTEGESISEDYPSDAFPCNASA
jgi:hypothetical protein